MKTWVLLTGLLCVLSSGFASEIKIKSLTDLERVEPWDTHLVYGDRVWVGKTQVGAVLSHRVESYNTDGVLEQTFELPFLPRQLFKLGKDGVLVIGTTSSPHWASHYAEITKVKGTYAMTKTYTFAEEYIVETFAEVGSTKFFNLQGERQIIKSNKSGWSVVNTEEILGPVEIVPAENALYVINMLNALGPQTSLSRLDLATGKVEYIFNKTRMGLKNLTRLKNGLLAVAETWNDNVIFFNPKTNTVEKEIAITSKEPRGLAEIGHCLAVASADTRIVTVFDLNTYNEVSKWDLTVAGPKFRKANKIGFDEKTGRLFARSTYMCPGCGETQSSVIMAEEVDQATFKACTK